MTVAKTRQVPPAWRIVYTFAPVFFLLLFLEGGLRLAGWTDLSGQAPLSRGFDREASYLKADPHRPGWWMTDMFEATHPEVSIPPKGDAHRVVLLGGSNTQGFPHQYLQDRLNEGSQGFSYEVLNLGRSGYGSERVGILAGQLGSIRPDLVVVYSGHNEFVEMSFAAELSQEGLVQSSGPFLRVLSRSRLFAFLRTLFSSEERVRHEGTRQGGNRPEPWTFDPKAFRGMTLQTTSRWMDAYRNNLEGICRESAAIGSDVMLCTLSRNDFSPPWGSAASQEADLSKVEKQKELRRLALKEIPPRFRRGLRPAIWLSGWDWGLALKQEDLKSRREAADPNPRVPRLRVLDASMSPRELEGADGVLPRALQGAHWTPPSDWTVSVTVLMDTMEKFHRDGLRKGEREQLLRASDLLFEARDLAPGDPNTLYDMGLVRMLLGDRKGGAHLLRRSAAEDRAPRRSNDALDNIVRGVAEKMESASLFDAQALFSSRCPDGLIGYEVMMDHCHLHPGARAILMEDLAAAILAMGEL